MFIECISAEGELRKRQALTEENPLAHPSLPLDIVFV